MHLSGEIKQPNLAQARLYARHCCKKPQCNNTFIQTGDLCSNKKRKIAKEKDRENSEHPEKIVAEISCVTGHCL